MHRVLLIQAGRAFDELVATLRSEHARRGDADGGGGLGLRAVRAPMEGSGHLERPVALLRERLSDELGAALSELFQLHGAPGGEELLLDLIVLVDLGQPMAARAAEIAMEHVVELLDARYDAIFPGHRRDAARRMRGLVFALLPADDECAAAPPETLEGGREGATSSLRGLHDGLETRRKESESSGARQWPVDRLFVLDALSPRGITPKGDLVDQLEIFLRALLFSRLRRHQTMVSLLEEPGRDLVASFGCAALLIDREGLRTRLAARLGNAIGIALTREDDVALPSWSEVTPPDALRDDDALELALAELDDAPARILGIDGPGALPALVRHYEDLCERLESWPLYDLLDASSDGAVEADAGVEDGGAATDVLAPALGALFGVSIFGAAHLATDLSLEVSAALGLGFAVIGATALLLVLRSNTARRTTSPAPTSSSTSVAQREAALARLEALQGAAEAQVLRLRALRSRLEGTRDALPARPSTSQAATEVPQIFLRAVGDEALVEALEGRWNPHATPSDAAAALVAERGGWQALLEEPGLVGAVALERYTGEVFAPILDAPIFEDADARHAIRASVDAFVDRWADGVPLAMSCDSLRHRDPDGVRLVLDQCILAPSALHPLLTERLDARRSRARLGPPADCLSAILLLHACTDIHADATSPLSTRPT